MSAPEVTVDAGLLEDIARVNPGVPVTFTADRGYLTLDGTTFVAELPVAGRVVCDARADLCRCHKDAGHVEAGDPVHSCPPDRCTAQWEGSFEDFDTFVVVRLPQPVGAPRPWDIA